MNIEQLTEFFKWVSIINVCVFAFSVVMCCMLRKIICRIHGGMFGLAEANVSIVLYSLMGFYKTMIMIFCIVPYIALLIIN